MEIVFTQYEKQKISSLPANTVFEFDGTTYIKIDDTRGIGDTNGIVTKRYMAISLSPNGFNLAAFALSDTMVKVLGNVKVKL